MSVITGDSERELKVEMKENEVRRRMEEKERTTWAGERTTNF